MNTEAGKGSPRRKAMEYNSAASDDEVAAAAELRVLNTEEICRAWEAKDFKCLSDMFARQAIRRSEAEIIGGEESVRQMVTIALECARQSDDPSLGANALRFIASLVHGRVLVELLIEAGLIQLCLELIVHKVAIRESAYVLCEIMIIKEGTYSELLANSVNPLDLIRLISSGREAHEVTAIVELVEALFMYQASVYNPEILASCVFELSKLLLNSESQMRVLNAMFCVFDRPDVVHLISQNEGIERCRILDFIHQHLDKSKASKKMALDVLARLLYHSDTVFPIQLEKIVRLADVGDNKAIVLGALNVLQNYCIVPDTIEAALNVGAFTVVADKIRAGCFSTTEVAAVILANMVSHSNPELFNTFMEEGVVNLLVRCLSVDGDSRAPSMRALIDLCDRAEQSGNHERFHDVLVTEGVFGVLEELERGAEGEEEELLKMIRERIVK